MKTTLATFFRCAAAIPCLTAGLARPRDTGHSLLVTPAARAIEVVFTTTPVAERTSNQFATCRGPVSALQCNPLGATRVVQRRGTGLEFTRIVSGVAPADGCFNPV